ncbi:hypothetical protein Tco_0468995 [Tanacetum coccineum]
MVKVLLNLSYNPLTHGRVLRWRRCSRGRVVTKLSSCLQRLNSGGELLKKRVAFILCKRVALQRFEQYRARVLNDFQLKKRKGNKAEIRCNNHILRQGYIKRTSTHSSITIHDAKDIWENVEDDSGSSELTKDEGNLSFIRGI